MRQVVGRELTERVQRRTGRLIEEVRQCTSAHGCQEGRSCRVCGRYHRWGRGADPGTGTVWPERLARRVGGPTRSISAGGVELWQANDSDTPIGLEAYLHRPRSVAQDMSKAQAEMLARSAAGCAWPGRPRRP